MSGESSASWGPRAWTTGRSSAVCGRSRAGPASEWARSTPKVERDQLGDRRLTRGRPAVSKQRAMATKRKTDHDSPRQRHGPETPAAKAAPADGPVSSERREEPSAPPASEPAAQERSN